MGDWNAQYRKIAGLRGAGNVNDVHAWHGTMGKNPLDIATGSNGFMVQFGREDGLFYNKGIYCAELPSYCHAGKYVYRSRDMEGRHGTPSGEYFHLILCKVILGKSWRLRDPLEPCLRDVQNFAEVHRQLQEKECDSVTGGTPLPLLSGGGENDSIMYVDYSGKQVLPEFIVTY